MATFYKYAERSAESQVNWSEIGKNMTDMLRDEVALREEKKAAIDEATRKYAEQLSNAPQGEHVGAKEEALRFADQASQYMLQQEKLLRSGLLNPKDYMVARQNLVDGTTRSFKAMKEFQAQYGELMERARTDKSSILEIQALEEIQGYGNFRQSGFFIDAPSGKVNVGLKEEQIIDGQKVMGLKNGSTRGMEYIDGAIYTRIDKFRAMDALTPIADSLGTEIQATLDPATLNKLGSIKSVEDLRNRKDIDPATGQILFDYYTSIRASVGTLISGSFQKASLLADTLGVKVTMDPNEAAKNPDLILKVVDPNTGRAEYQFSDKLEKKAEDWMTQQLLSMVTRKETITQGGQVQRQDEPEWKANQRAGIKENEIAAGYWNDILSAKNTQEAQAAADVLIGTPRAIDMGLTEMDFTSNPGSVLLKYADPAMDRTIKIFDDSGIPVNRRDWAALGVELHGVVDRDKAIKAGGGTKEYGGLTKEQYTKIGTKRQGVEPTTKFNVPVSAINLDSNEAAVSLSASAPEGFEVKDETPNYGDEVSIKHIKTGKVLRFPTQKTGEAAADIVKDIQNFYKQYYEAPAPKEEAAAAGASGTTAAGLPPSR